MGWYAHRAGYNVLYGNWSAKWHGDPQKRIMWWPSVTYGDYYDQGFNALRVNALHMYADPRDGSSASSGQHERSDWIWQTLDVDAGIDAP